MWKRTADTGVVRPSPLLRRDNDMTCRQEGAKPRPRATATATAAAAAAASSLKADDLWRLEGGGSTGRRPLSRSPPVLRRIPFGPVWISIMNATLSSNELED